MNLARTTLRIDANLKKTAQAKALQDNTTLQDVFNRALAAYVQESAKKDAKTLVFKTHNLGEPLDNLTRSDYYPEA